MTDDWMLHAEAICLRCDGHCCTGACPPVSEPCYRRLRDGGVPEEAFARDGYRHIRCRPDGSCYLRNNGKCGIHGIKPETCRAGPFTFDREGDRIRLWLKYESICPLVRLLKDVPEAYRLQYDLAVRSIGHLVANLPEDELAAICRIEEPETEFVGYLPGKP